MVPQQDSRTAQILRYEAELLKGVEPSVPCCTTRLTSCTVGQLLGGQRFCFRVRAVSSVGPSVYSNASCFETSAATHPATAFGPFPLHTTVGSISVGWEPVENNGALVDQYEVSTTTTPHETGNWATHPECAHSRPVQGCVVSGLSRNTEYGFRMRAHNSVGWGGYSGVLTYHSNKQFPTIPSAPQNVRDVNITESSITVTWDDADDGGAQVLNYTAEVSEASRPGATPKRYPVVLASHKLVAVDLASLQQYCFRVCATNSVGVGAWSKALCTTTSKPRPPLAPYLYPTPVATSSGSLEVDWVRPTNNAGLQMTYEVQRDDYWTDGPLATVHTGSSALNYTSSVNLLPATAYSFRVRGVSSAGTGDWSQVHSYATDTNGACGNAADVAAYRRTKKTMKLNIQLCLIKCKAKVCLLPRAPCPVPRAL